MRAANLTSANLRKVALSGNLNGANFTGASLNEARLGSVDLQDIIYDSKTNWHKARYNKNTKFPPGFEEDIKKSMIFRKLY